MAPSKSPFHAPRPKYVKRLTDILPPSVRTDWVNGEVKYEFIEPEVGPTRIFDSDEEDETKPIPRAVTPRIKREHSNSPSRAMGQGQSWERHPRIKQESAASSPRGQRSHGLFSSPVNCSQRRRSQKVVGSKGRLKKATKQESSDDSSSSSDSDDPTSGNRPAAASDSSDSESDDTTSSSDSDSDSDVYTPSTSLSRISSTSTRTRRQTTQAPSTNTAQEAKHTPLDFYINVPRRVAQCQVKNSESSRSQASLQGTPSPHVSYHKAHE